MWEERLVQQLVVSGHKVRILTRDPSKAPPANNRIELAIGDLEKRDTLLESDEWNRANFSSDWKYATGQECP